jgi:DNA polymerase-3 subunit epsilon
MRTTITDYLTLERPLIIFDLETTGLSKEEDKILEIAYEKIMPSGEIESKCLRLNPQRDIPDDASRINGIYWDDVKDEPTFPSLAFEMWNMFEGADVGGFNVIGFDLPFLRAQFATVGKNFEFSTRKILDAKVLYHAKEPRDMFAPRNLTAAYKLYCGKDHINAHTGAADVRATVEILEEILKRYPEFSDWEKIAEMHGNKSILETVKGEHASLEETIAAREKNSSLF